MMRRKRFRSNWRNRDFIPSFASCVRGRSIRRRAFPSGAESIHRPRPALPSPACGRGWLVRSDSEARAGRGCFVRNQSAPLSPTSLTAFARHPLPVNGERGKRVHECRFCVLTFLKINVEAVTMAKIVFGAGTSHTPMLLASDETLQRFVETDRNIKHRDKEGHPVTYGDLLEKAD